MTLLYKDSQFLDHVTGNHPERPLRLKTAYDHLDRSQLAARCVQPRFDAAGRTELERAHAPAYIDEVESFARRGGGYLDSDTVACPRSFDVARLAAGAVVDAVGRIVRGEDRNALCLIRPPGHHALADRAMGFCLFSNVAIGARAATDEHGLDRVMIVDFDVHHGNGTQDAFWTDPRVGFFSIHRWPFYPGTGDSDETGHADGLGSTLNVPIEFGLPRQEYLAAFRTKLERFADRIKPQLILISAGFDAHAADPIGSLGLETEDFGVLTDTVLDIADVHAGGRVVSVLEGGYNPPILAECIGLHLEHLLDRETSKGIESKAT